MVRAFVMTETLEAGSAVVEALGVHLGVQLADDWQPDRTFLGGIRLEDAWREVRGLFKFS